MFKYRIKETNRFDNAMHKLQQAHEDTIRAMCNRIKIAFYRNFDEIIPSIMADEIDEIAKEFGVDLTKDE